MESNWVRTGMWVVGWLVTSLVQGHEFQSPNPQTGGNFGRAVDGSPDTNGNGSGDVVIGAFQETVSGQAGAGRVYVFDGYTANLLHTLVSPSPETDGGYGIEVDGIPDTNGDGAGDILVGAWREDPGVAPEDAGRAYIYDGSSGTLLHTLISPNQQLYGRFAEALAGMNDTNGNGRGDVIIGAWQEDLGGPLVDAGRAYIFDGSAATLLHTLVSPSPEAGGRFGFAVSGVPDLTGDGLEDVVVGAVYEDVLPAGTDAGRAYVFNGSTGALLHALSSPLAEAYGAFGVEVNGIPDLTGDGLGDVIVGAFDEDRPGAPGAGRAYVFDGFSGALLHILESPNPETGGSFGDSVAGVADFNGDGRGDVIVSAPEEYSEAGRAYIYSGSDAVLLRTHVAPTPQPGSRFGNMVGGVPDVNGDGIGEAILGARLEDTTHTDAGRAYLYNGATGFLVPVDAWPEY